MNQWNFTCFCLWSTRWQIYWSIL